VKEIVELSPHAVWGLGHVLLSEIRSDYYTTVIDVGKVKPIHHIWGGDYVIG